MYSDGVAEVVPEGDTIESQPEWYNLSSLPLLLSRVEEVLRRKAAPNQSQRFAEYRGCL